MMKRILPAMLTLCLLLACCPAPAEETPAFDGTLKMENGTLLPMLKLNDPRDPDYMNEGSDILRYCVYVETDNDTDNDGLADLVKAVVQVPRGAAEGKYKAASIYDPTPYGAGTVDEAIAGDDGHNLFVEKPFDYDTLYRSCEKRDPAGEMTTLEAAKTADPKGWNYTVPMNPDPGILYMGHYDYYLERGFAVVCASGIGTYGSEGFELCGMPLERDSHKAVVEWLAGDRRAFTDRKQNIEIKADWSNGKVAMIGASYGGTLAFEVATTGVKGLETIVPIAGIASWYDYTNAQGVPTTQAVSYANALAANNCGGTFLDEEWKVPNKEYGSWLWQIAQDQLEANGNYTPIWEQSDYTRDWANIRCPALIVQGLNDYNVDSRQADLMAQSFEKAGVNYKLVLHQDGHTGLNNMIVHGELWQETLLRWFAHYLYGMENGAENLPAVLAQSNLDGSWKAYESWRDFAYADAPVSYKEDKTTVSTQGLAPLAYEYLGGTNDDNARFELRDQYYWTLPDGICAKYELDLPEGASIYGVPEVHVRLCCSTQEYEGLMITAVLADSADDGSAFNAYRLKDSLNQLLPTQEIGEDARVGALQEYVQDSGTVKTVSYAWTDLTNPGCGPDSSEYAETVRLEAGEFYDYTFYMLPTVYTVAPGHHLTLILTTWDPYRSFLDESFDSLDTSASGVSIDYDYSYIIDNESIQVRLPLAAESVAE